MEFIDSYAFQHWAGQFLVVLFLVASLVGLAVGVGLIVASAGTRRFLVVMNRWVSTRRAFKPIEVIRDTSQTVRKHRRWLAVVFIAGGAFSIFGLATWFDTRAAGIAFGLDMQPYSVASWLVESVGRVLIVGNLVAMVVGIMLGFFPAALDALEARGSRWYSDRQLVKGGDAMHLSLDDWVAASPRFAGWIIMAAGLVLAGEFGIMLSGMR